MVSALDTGKMGSVCVCVWGGGRSEHTSLRTLRLQLSDCKGNLAGGPEAPFWSVGVCI